MLLPSFESSVGKRLAFVQWHKALDVGGKDQEFFEATH
jgi:hypothetical protein